MPTLLLVEPIDQTQGVTRFNGQSRGSRYGRKMVRQDRDLGQRSNENLFLSVGLEVFEAVRILIDEDLYGIN
jgi:hypothetical protein